MRIALTGATGFLGRYIARLLAQAGHRLVCWHRPTSDRTGFENLQHALTWQEGTLGDLSATTQLLAGADAVVHAAVDWEGPRNRNRTSPHDLDVFMHHNLMGSLALMQSAFQAKVPRFIFISSCAVHEIILPGRPLDETHPLWANNHYGAYKGAVEKFIHSFGFGSNWPVCSLRPTGIYGVDHPPENSRYFELIAQVVQGQDIETARGGKEVHAHDVARAVELLLHADGPTIAGQAYNCYDLYVSEEKVAQIAKQITGSKSRISSLNQGPKNQIVTEKIRKLGMTFGGEKLLQETVRDLVTAVENRSRERKAAGKE